jgi:glycerophosphoryl diester phosphodiesterase
MLHQRPDSRRVQDPRSQDGRQQPCGHHGRGLPWRHRRWRTDLYTGRAQVVTFKESIAINQQNGVKHTPELKGTTHQDRIDAIFGGQDQYAQKFIDTLRDAGVKPKDAWVQSFNLDDIRYWIKHEPAFGKQAVYLDSIDPTVNPAIPRLSFKDLKSLKKRSVRVFAPRCGRCWTWTMTR